MSNAFVDMDYANINGVNLSLKIRPRNSSPKSLIAIISYKSNIGKATWPLQSLFLAVLFNLLAVCFVKISMRTTAIIVIIMAFIIYFWVTHSVQSESIIVIPTVGVQLSVKYVVGHEDHFVPWVHIDDVIINEVIKLNRVLYFLTLVIKMNTSSSRRGDIRLIPLFKYTKPRLPMLQKIYSEIQQLLTVQMREGPPPGAGDQALEFI